jgi:hypothetical protein
LASSATAVRDNIDSAKAPNITSFFIYNSCVRRFLLAAFDRRLVGEIELAGSLERLMAAKLRASDKKLQKQAAILPPGR